jgi:hypothetical protein
MLYHSLVVLIFKIGTNYALFHKYGTPIKVRLPTHQLPSGLDNLIRQINNSCWQVHVTSQLHPTLCL